MIIRSQDKKSIFNIENIKSIKVGVVFTTWAGKSCDISIDGEAIATYSTEEKALKVLDMIAMRYYKANQYFESSGFVENAVFEMPADEDVEV